MATDNEKHLQESSEYTYIYIYVCMYLYLCIYI